MKKALLKIIPGRLYYFEKTSICLYNEAAKMFQGNVPGCWFLVPGSLYIKLSASVWWN